MRRFILKINPQHNSTLDIIWKTDSPINWTTLVNDFQNLIENINLGITMKSVRGHSSKDTKELRIKVNGTKAEDLYNYIINNDIIMDCRDQGFEFFIIRNT